MLATAKITISILPVFAFLLALFFLDSYKLIRFRSILVATLVGMVVALSCFMINRWLLSEVDLAVSLLHKTIFNYTAERFKSRIL